jgi:hypothetical protein
MSTGGSFDPASTPPCPTATMTRAALIALRTASTLRTECPYFISDGPVIGTTGNTSATVLELNATATNELSLDVKVHTTFDNTAWSGLYDIDLGTAGTLLEVRDNQGNVVRSTVADAPTVQTQFPWHLTGGGLVQNNYIEASTLTGWASITTTVRGNQITRNSTVALTGNWGIFTDNRIEASTVSLLHAAGGTRTFSGNTVRAASVFRTLLGATGSWTVTNNDFLDGYVFEGAAASTATTVINGSRFENHGATAIDASVTGSGTRDFSNTRSVTSGAAQQYTLTGTGAAVSVSDSDFLEGRLTLSTGATRGIAVVASTVRTGLITQTRTGGTGMDTITGSDVSGTGTVVTLAGATDPGGAQTVLAGSQVSEGGTLTLTNPAGSGGVVVVNTMINSGATVSGTATVQIDRCRFSTGATFTAGAFTHDRSIVDGNLAVTPTASNTNRLANPAFNNWV